MNIYKRSNYETEFCNEKGWTFVDEIHYDAVDENNQRIEIKKFRGAGPVIKLYNLADVILNNMNVVYYLVQWDNSGIVAEYSISPEKIAEDLGYSREDLEIFKDIRHRVEKNVKGSAFQITYPKRYFQIKS